MSLLSSEIAIFAAWKALKGRGLSHFYGVWGEKVKKELKKDEK